MTTKEEVSMPEVPNWVQKHRNDCVAVEGDPDHSELGQKTTPICREEIPLYAYRLIPKGSWGADPIIVGHDLENLLYWWADQEYWGRAWRAKEFDLVTPLCVAVVGFTSRDSESMAGLWVSVDDPMERSVLTNAMSAVSHLLGECFGPKRVTFEF